MLHAIQDPDEARRFDEHPSRQIGLGEGPLQRKPSQYLGLSEGDPLWGNLLVKRPHIGMVCHKKPVSEAVFKIVTKQGKSRSLISTNNRKFVSILTIAT